MTAPIKTAPQSADPESAYLSRLGDRVRAWRTENGMTRKALSGASGVSERYLAQLESGLGNISVLLLRKVARAMGVAVDRLVRENEGAPRAERIALIGLRGAGKSTLGGKLARSLDIPFVELDKEVEKEAGAKLGVDGRVPRLTLDAREDKGLVPGSKLKLNSYDLGVDIELHDALNRIRFEHPEVRSVVVTSGKSRMFCSGANIYMLGHSSHAWKVNFCKFTNETRNGIEDASAQSGLKFIAALNGTTAGGGYELALACDEIAMIDDRSSTVSLPEVPLLGVLPGTGGLTRIIDKRKVRRDIADVFCTTAEGVRADRARQWKLVDHLAKPQQFAEFVKARALELAQRSDRPGGQGV